MTSRSRGLAAAAVLAVIMTGCADRERRPTEPQLSTESACYGSGNPDRCRLKHDLAGGYPIARGGGR